MKLTYFNLRGRGEPIRFVLAAAGVKYEDKRIEHSEWSALKSSTPWGQLPILETDDGLVMAQTIPICRYVAVKNNLAGSNEWEAAKCDEYIAAFTDLFLEWVGFFWDEKDDGKRETKKQHFLQTSFPNFFGKLNTIIKENGGSFLVGKGLTWADVFITCVFDDIEITCGHGLLKDYPEVGKMRHAVLALPGVKAWIDGRPAEDLVAVQKALKP